MRITPIAVTQSVLENDDKRQDKLFELGAKVMGVCVNTSPVDKMRAEPLDKTLKRKDTTLTERHHSGYGMEDIVLGIEDVSKIFCMHLNNLHIYDTEETSGRHTKLRLSSKEQAVFDYFYDKIYKSFLEKDDVQDKASLRKYNQIALENARYITGLDAKTNIVYKATLRQWNYIYGWVEEFLDKKDYNQYEQLVLPDFREFVSQMDNLEIDGVKIINPNLRDFYNHGFKLFGDFKKKQEIYDPDLYKVYYDSSSTAYGQLQRHRQITYIIDNPDKQKDISYYVPQIIKKLDLQDEWQDKIDSIHNVPQARKMLIKEVGQPYMIADRLKERACNHAQEETRFISSMVADRVFKGLASVDMDFSTKLCEMYLDKNRRSFPDYRCPPCRNPCSKDDVITAEKLEQFY